MKKKIQNKLGTYLAVTAGVGCAASVAEGAIVVVDLSGLSNGNGNKTLPGETGDLVVDFNFLASIDGDLRRLGTASFYSDGVGAFNQTVFGRGYQGLTLADFPTDPDAYVFWFVGSPAGGFAVGENWVAFKDSANNFGWLSFTLNSLVSNNNNPITSFGHFVYDAASTGPANAITLQAAVAAAAVPEPSSLVLLALGATGLAARRQRKKAA